MFEYDIDPHQPLVDQLAPELALTRIEGGAARVPTGPGLGIDIDEAVLDDFPHVTGGTYAEVFHRPRDRPPDVRVPPRHQTATGHCVLESGSNLVTLILDIENAR